MMQVHVSSGMQETCRDVPGRRRIVYLTVEVVYVGGEGQIVDVAAQIAE